jgi:peptide/nickel transport system substrate-binding protein
MVRTSRFLLSLVLLASLALSFSASIAQGQPTTFAGGWPYKVPPDGHFNTFAANGILQDSIYIDLMEPPLAVYIWAKGEYEGMLAQSFGFDKDNNYVVKVKDGVTWSDGKKLTSADVVATFNTLYLINTSLQNDLKSVEAVDDLTAKFVLKTPSLAAERRILTLAIRSGSVYGDIAGRAAKMMADGKKTGAADFDALVTELAKFRPKEWVSAGPYKLLAENVTDAKVTLVKNNGGLNADNVKFDQVVLWNGETEAVTPLVANGELYYGTYGFPPASEAAFIDKGIDIIRGPSYSGPALYVNHSVAPLDRVEVRQAMAYAINREENGFVSLGKSGISHDSMSGLSDNLVPLWLSDEVQKKLNHYDYDVKKAASLLEGIGFKKGSDGIWMDDKGKPLAFELIFPAEFLDWAAAAENVTKQLNDFGFKITAKGVQFQQQPQDVYDGNFQLAIRNWGTSSPFANVSYLEPYDRYNGQGQFAGEGAKGGGMRFKPDVTYSGGKLNVRDLALKAGEGLDKKAQAQLVDQLALSFNELLPCIPLWERYGNNPMNRKFLDVPAGDDPIYKNAGVDHFMPYLIMTGKAGPAKK